MVANHEERAFRGEVVLSGNLDSEGEGQRQSPGCACDSSRNPSSRVLQSGSLLNHGRPPAVQDKGPYNSHGLPERWCSKSMSSTARAPSKWAFMSSDSNPNSAAKAGQSTLSSSATPLP